MSDVSHPQFSSALAEVEARGLVSRVTESNLPEAAAAGQLYVYGGFDPTKPSLQIGNLVPVIVLAHFQRAGHRPILVVGGGTGMIGDPGGKDEERVLLSSEQVRQIAECVSQKLRGDLDFEGPHAAILGIYWVWHGHMPPITSTAVTSKS